tara:strand:- start:1570 stop:2184 length:615 start_codon:yes stop_codon:yes gene_type:complete
MIGLGQNKYDIELKKEIIQEYLQLKFSNITLSNKAISDRYEYKYQYSQAERGWLYLIADLKVISKSKSPLLPCLFVYSIDENNNLDLISSGPVQYKFYEWENSRTFNGLERDHNNDFKYTKEVNFSLSSYLKEYEVDWLGMPTDLNKTTFVLLIRKNDNKVYKRAYKGEAPPLRYLTSDCNFEYELTLERAKEQFHFIEIFNGL